MFISLNSHELIVEELRNQLVQRQHAHDLVVAELRVQIINLTAERDWYRRNWTKARGQAFTTKSEEEAPKMPLFDQTQPAPLDADWTPDDRQMFREWSYGIAPHLNPEEEWERRYGRSSPLLTLTE